MVTNRHYSAVESADGSNCRVQTVYEYLLIGAGAGTKKVWKVFLKQGMQKRNGAYFFQVQTIQYVILVYAIKCHTVQQNV